MPDGTSDARTPRRRPSTIVMVVLLLQTIWLAALVAPTTFEASAQPSGPSGPTEPDPPPDPTEEPEEEDPCDEEDPDPEECPPEPPRTRRPRRTLTPRTTSAPPVAPARTTTGGRRRAPTVVEPLASPSPSPSPLPTPGQVDPSFDVEGPSAPPGGTAIASGRGCTPASPVRLEIDGDEVGRATADDFGSFTTDIEVPELPVGRYDVVARCGPTLTAPLDVVLSNSAQGASWTLGVLAFFFLGGLLLSRARFGG